MSEVILAIGEPHPMWLSQETGGAVFNDDISHFVIGFERPTSAAIATFQSQGKMGVLRYKGLLVITLNFGSMISVSFPYHASLAQRYDRPSLHSKGEQHLFTFALVNSMSREIISLRAATISSFVSEIINRTILEQLDMPITEIEFEKLAIDWNRQYPTGSSVIRISSFSKLGFGGLPSPCLFLASNPPQDSGQGT